MSDIRLLLEQKFFTLENENKKLINEMKSMKQAIKRLEVRVLDVARQSETAYHASHDAKNQIGRIDQILRKL